MLFRPIFNSIQFKLLCVYVIHIAFSTCMTNIVLRSNDTKRKKSEKERKQIKTRIKQKANKNGFRMTKAFLISINHSQLISLF